MADFTFPLTSNLTREDLSRYAPGTQRFAPEYYAGGEQKLPNPYSAQLAGLGATGLGAAGVAGLFAGVRATGRNPWNAVYGGLRLAEDYSPGQIFRTFQLGNLTSQLADTGLASRSITASQIAELEHTKWLDDLLHRVPNASKAITHGLQFEGGQLRAGPHLLLKHATTMVTTGEPHAAVAYSRAAGFKGIPEVGAAKSFTKPIKEMFGEGFVFLGGDTRRQAAGRQVHGFLTESIVGRVNRLASAPFELEPIRTITAKAGDFAEKLTGGVRPRLAVEAGALMPTLGRMALKWGGAGTAGYLGYQTADWAVRNFPLFDWTPFDEGITAGVATAGVQLNKLAANIADVVPGLRSYQDWQEEAAPGSTSLTKLAAFPLTGAMGGMSATYALGFYDRTKYLRQNMKAGMDISSALTHADASVIQQSKSFARQSHLGQAILKRYGENRVPLFGSLSKTKLWSVYGAAVGGLLTLPFLPGALIPEKTGDELDAIYSGEQEVTIRKGRWWELGRTPYEGTRIEYFRPHWYPRMMQGSTRKGLYEDDPNPISQWFSENFTYDFEREHYYDRPYPITGAAFEDIPIVGPILSATVGRLVKPQKLMHTEEWTGEGAAASRERMAAQNREYTQNAPVKRIQERYGEVPAFELGETPPGTPIAPGSLKNVIGEQAYRLTELSGLVGFSFSSLKGMITGEEEFFGQEEILQSARRAYGAERSYWDMSIGGGLGTTEFFRRLYPHRRRQIPEYNPIRNLMPAWMPGPGQKSPDFLHGDPYTKVKEGELRLPGKGFAARFPELEGVDPADYPAIFRYKILADVAPYSDQFDIAENQVKRDMNRGYLSPSQVDLYQRIREQTKEKNKSRTNFFEYQVLKRQSDASIPGANQSSGVLSMINDRLASGESKRGMLSTLAGGYWEGIVGAAQNPIEALSPLAPASKFISLETSMEKYKRTQVYGPEIAFWQDPLQNFILPFFRESADMFGQENIPTSVGKRRQVQEYFDILDYTKNKRLESAARREGLSSVANKYKLEASRTVTGVNPYSRNYSNIFRALPRAERDYFTSFVGAKSGAERQTILDMIPASERKIYEAQWELAYAEQIQQAMAEGVVPDNLREQAIAEVSRIFDKKQGEGFPINPELIDQYEDDKRGDESYSDWFRRSILIPEATSDMGGLPGPDWVGWHPGVDLDDVKLKVVKAEGMDIHDFNLWESDERAVAQKGYLDDAAHELEEIQGLAPERSPSQVERELRSLMSELEIVGTVHVSALESSHQSYTITVDATEDRKQELRRELAEAGF